MAPSCTRAMDASKRVALSHPLLEGVGAETSRFAAARSGGGRWAPGNVIDRGPVRSEARCPHADPVRAALHDARRDRDLGA